jgi:hypothetical protein
MLAFFNGRLHLKSKMTYWALQSAVINKLKECDEVVYIGYRSIHGRLDPENSLII